MEVTNSNDNDNDKLENVENVENVEEKDELKKKKKKHFFEHHIRKILKNVSSDRDITCQAKSQLNDLAIITCRIIFEKINYILSFSKKKTVMESDIDSAVKLVFTGQLAQKCSEEGQKCLKVYLEKVNLTELKGQSRHSKADILVPPSIIDYFMRQNCDYHISYNAPVYLAGVMEYFLSQVLVLSNTVSAAKKNIRITVNDLEYGIRSDKELSHFFSKYNIYFYDSGIIPYVHPMVKVDKKKQKIEKRVFSRTSFEVKFKNYINLVYPEMRFQKDCFEVLQNYLEHWIIDVLKYANILTVYSKKSRIHQHDIDFVLAVMNRDIPIFLKELKHTVQQDAIPFPEEDMAEDEENKDNDDKDEKDEKDE